MWKTKRAKNKFNLDFTNLSLEITYMKYYISVTNFKIENYYQFISIYYFIV